MKLFISFFFLCRPLAFAAMGISAGPKLGTYYQIAQDIKKHLPLFDFTVLQSAGSVDNLKKLHRDPKINLAFAQMDVLKSLKDLGLITFQNTKLILPLYSEEIHIIAHKQSNIESVEGLKGKKVNVGKELSGSQFTSRLVAEELKIKWQESTWPVKKALKLLLNKRIDAIFLTVGKPAKIYELLPKEARSLLKFVPLNNFKLRKYYQSRTIPNGTYSWQDEDIPTYSVFSVLLSKSQKDKMTMKRIGEFYHQLVQNHKKLKRSGHPKWREINPSLNGQRLHWPLHPALLKFRKTKK